MTFLKIFALIFGLLLVLTGGFCVLASVNNRVAAEPLMLISLVTLAAGVGLLMFAFRKPDSS
jgi:uncharacterized membrane protein HdeD (DUF308 family)